MRFWQRFTVRILSPVAALAVLAGTAGCDTFRGPGIEYTAPRIEGRVLGADGQPVAHARVGRRVWRFRNGQGDLPKGAEELVLHQSWVQTDDAGHFTLPSQQVAFLFQLGDTPLNLDLVIQHRRHQTWHTNYPFARIDTNSLAGELRLPAGEIQLLAR